MSGERQLRILRVSVAAVAALVALLASAAAPSQLEGARAAAQVGNCTPDAGWGTNRADFADRVVQLVNQHRASLGLRQLGVSSPLAAASVWKAMHMAGYRYMSHNDPAPPVARSTGDRVAVCGYSGGGWGENIAYGYPTPESVMNGWLNSPGHKSNIENPSWTAIGVGAAAAAGGTMYWAQVFGTSTGGTAPAPTPTQTTTPTQSTPPPQTTAPTQSSTPTQTSTPAPSQTSTPTTTYMPPGYTPTYVYAARDKPPAPSPTATSTPAPQQTSQPQQAPQPQQTSQPQTQQTPQPQPQPTQQPQAPRTQQPQSQPQQPAATQKPQNSEAANAAEQRPLVSLAFQPLAGRPQRGEWFGGTVGFLHSTGARVTGGRVTCRGWIGTERLAVVRSGFERQIARCVWRVPANARGTVVRGTVRVKAKSKIAQRTFWMRVRPSR